MQAWKLYLDEFMRRAARADELRFGRQELLTQAAHDAYQTTADRLTREHDWSDEHTLVVLRGLNAAVQQWLDLGGGDWDVLAADLRRREDSLRPSDGATSGGSATRTGRST